MDGQAEPAPSTPTGSEDENDSYMDDPLDTNFAVGKPAKNTPNQRRAFAEDCSSQAKRRVDKATKDLTQGRCIITNAPEFCCVQYAHLLPRAVDSSLLDRLEYSWGMKLGTLHIDSRYNIMRLNVYLHCLFDSCAWLLLPEEAVLSDLFERARRRPDEGFRAFLKERATYNYTLIPASSMSAVPIWRYSRALDRETVALPEHFDPLHFYPFDQFPTLTSHVHPHFVICNLGLKMKSRGLDYAGAHSNTRERISERLFKATTIFQAWIDDIPENADKFFGDFQPPANNDDNDSTFTKQGRLDNDAYAGSLRQRGTAGGSPSSTSRKRRRAVRGPQESGSVWLDDETLRELDENASPTKRFGKKMEMVAGWVSEVESECV